MTELWRTKLAVSIKCPCLTFSAAMSHLDVKISLVPKHKLIVPSTLTYWPLQHTSKQTKPQSRNDMYSNLFQNYSTLASWNYSQCLKILARNTLLSENNSSRQQLITPNFVWWHNMSCLHPIWFFLMCTCLDATDGKWE